MSAAGASHRAVATKFNVSDDSVWRHWTRHVSNERKAQIVAGPLKLHDLAERAAEEGLSLLDYLSLVRSTLLSQFTSSAEAGDRHGTASIAGRLLECLREIGRLTGELRSVAGVNVVNNVMILNSPAFAELQRMLLERLAPYADARASVLAGLRELDARLGAGTPNAAPGASPSLSRGPVIEAEASVEGQAA
jgi:hypothetical protein